MCNETFPGAFHCPVKTFLKNRTLSESRVFRCVLLEYICLSSHVFETPFEVMTYNGFEVFPWLYAVDLSIIQPTMFGQRLCNKSQDLITSPRSRIYRSGLTELLNTIRCESTTTFQVRFAHVSLAESK